MAAAKVSVAAAQMAQGNLSNVEWFRGIGEYKIDWGPGYRIYLAKDCLLYTSPSPRDRQKSRMPSSA